uniref:Beta-microseminoprotein n=1 Tax=Monodelphis domestica TaxID=13616 RepID=A0A5F8GK64_MONDO
NTILGILLTWTIFGTLYEAQCTDIPLEFKTDDHSNGCKDRHGEFHELNIYWISDYCEICQCDEEEMECSSLILRPADYDKEKCEEVFDRESCIFKPVEKDNPSKSCNATEYFV